MKKIIYFALAIFFIMAGVSFAGTWSVTSSGVSGVTTNGASVNDVKASKNVTIEVNSVAQSYAASAGHKSGDKAYGVSSGNSLIMYNSKTKGTDWTTVPTASDSSAFSGWSSM